jgi:hypothetical protein
MRLLHRLCAVGLKRKNHQSLCVKPMVKQLKNSEYDLMSDRNQNKYLVFEQVREFLDLNGILWQHMFQLLRKSESGCLNYKFGDVSICFDRMGHWNEKTDDLEDEIELSVKSDKDGFCKKLTYNYKMKELSRWRKTRQSEIDDYGE